MRIAILTYHRAYNCGAMLQAWALKTVLERMGHIVEFPILNHVGELGRWPLKWVHWRMNPFRVLLSFARRSLYNLSSIPSEDVLRFRFRRFRERYLPERHCGCRDLAKHYDSIVIGSDQVWSEAHSGRFAPVFFAESLPTSIPVIGYAVSYGDHALPEGKLARIAAAYSRFQAVSARERIVQKQMEDIGCGKPDITLDPTLLLFKTDYLHFSGSVNAPSKPFLFMYTLSTRPFFVETARSIAKRLGVQAIIAPMYQRTRVDAPHGLTYGISPDRLVSYISKAKYVLAGSFHGTALSVVMGKPFLSLREEAENPDSPSRPGTLLKLLSCEERLVTPETSIVEMIARLTAPMPEIHALYEAKETSLLWLQKHLQK